MRTLITSLGLSASVVAALIAAHGCAAEVTESNPPADAGMDAQSDADDGKLHCWCKDDAGPATADPHNGGMLCNAGDVCGLEDPNIQNWSCCTPKDDGIPNCYDDQSGQPGGHVPASPNYLVCKPPP